MIKHLGTNTLLCSKADWRGKRHQQQEVLVEEWLPLELGGRFCLSLDHALGLWPGSVLALPGPPRWLQSLHLTPRLRSLPPHCPPHPLTPLEAHMSFSAGQEEDRLESMHTSVLHLEPEWPGSRMNYRQATVLCYLQLTFEQIKRQVIMTRTTEVQPTDIDCRKT